MPLSNRKYGVEIEAFGLTRQTVARLISQAGIPCHVEEYGHVTPRHWKVVTDSSVTDDNGFEVVSPILQGENGFLQIETVMKILTIAGARVDKSCGLHVHVDANNLTGSDIRSIVKRYTASESLIDSIMPSNRRASNNGYCRTLTAGYYRLISETTTENINDIASAVSSHRRYKVNIAAYLRHGTVEFRHHSGTINSEKAINWVKFCLNFVEKSVVRNNQDNIQSIPSAPRMNPKHILIKEMVSRSGTQDNFGYIRDDGATLTELVEATGLSAATVKAYISFIRTNFNINIGYRRWQEGYYVTTRTSRRTRRARVSRAAANPLTGLNVSDSPFVGLDTATVAYYNERRSEFVGE